MFENAADNLRERDAFHDLLPALARGLDVRDIFRQLSTVAARIVPHDEATLLVQKSDGHFEMFASTGTPREVTCVGGREQTLNTREPQLLDSIPEPDRGLLSGLTVPVRTNDQFFGVLAMFSQRPQAYSARDLADAERLAAYLALAISHQRLADVVRDAALDRERAASIETSVELLRTIAGVLDVRSVFPRISAITSKILPHDALMMVFHDGNGKIVHEAATEGVPSLTPHAAHGPQPDHFIIDDLATDDLPVVIVGESPRAKLLAAGFRSVLAINTRARDQLMGVGFMSKRARAFSEADIPVARRIADHIALAISHEQLAEAARQVAEAQARSERLEARVQKLSDELDAKTHARVVGESAPWKDVLKKATQVATTETTVLLTGESGTGKEVVARFIHRASGRKNGPFVAINCAALPEQLLESELFGYERGAFTSAQQAKPGQLELAAGGVLFLDEVSEMSLAAQAKFLRVLQEREFQRLGGTRVIKANIRVIAATNRDLRKAVDRGDFREDLFYRLLVFDIRIPPLRERPSDILPLSETFLNEIGKSFGRPPAGLTKDAREALLGHEWPGNVRELRNALERAAILAEGGLIHTHHLALQSRSTATGQQTTTTTNLLTFERETIERVLRDTLWNKSKAAKRLGLSRTQLYVRMRKYGLEGAPPVQN
ncbi:MAG TPA: sigma 54-interacting transcriptional regulator [Vicinamibacterales bacterium]|nr:sigma 54-interacting transcriptional regulator [Vicinamibacterales bacterium]